jgi:glucose/arabinose dehydrogenase
MTMRPSPAVVAFAMLSALAAESAAQATGAAPAPAAELPFQVQVVADFESPWAMTFLPDGRMLVTEKAGTLYLVTADGQQRKSVGGVPQVAAEGQGGLMDVVLHPRFAQNQWVYFSYSEAGAGGKGVVLARGTLADGETPALQKVETLFRGTPYVPGDGHFAGRIAFAPDGHLFFTNGERQKFDPAQDPKATLGKVLRLNDDGTPAKDNPLAAKGFHPAVWSYGHRNPLGIAFDASGNLWEQEMGPKGGDEVNLILPGRNYGYPIVSDGVHYDDKPIPDHDTRPEFEKYKVNWTPVISPGGLIVYSGKLFPQWKGDLFIGGLSSQALVRVDVEGTNARKGDQWPMGSRIREPEEGPDGAIWLLEDGQRGSQGRLLKLTPKGAGASR